MKAFLLLMAVWALWGQLCFSLGLVEVCPTGLSSCRPWPLEHVLKMTDGRKTGDGAKPHENTQNFRAGVTL